MSGSLLSNLTAATSPEGDELIYVVQDGGDRKMTIAQTRIGADSGVGSGLPGTSLTFTAGTGDGAGDGGDIFLYTGGGYETGYFYAKGANNLTAGGGNAGSVGIAAGNGNPAGADSYPGYINIRSGDAGLGNIDGAPIELRSGNNSGSGIGGDISLILGGVQKGAVTFNNNSSLLPIPGSWAPGEAVDGVIIHTSTRAERVTSIIGRIKAANGSAATLVLVKCASGVAPGSGVALSTNSVNLAGSVDTNQTLTLHGTAANLLLAAGDSLIMVTTGSLVLAAGAITCWMTPQ